MHNLPHRLTGAVGCTDCSQDACAVNNELTSQCTERCVVIACHDPDHSGANCDGQGDQELCNLVCDSSTNCVDCNGFDAFLQCCGDYHSYLSDAPMQSQWGPSRHPSMNVGTQQSNIWCDSCAPHPPQMASQNHHTTFDLPHKCRWDGCRQSYGSLSELIGHVNLSHLAGSSGFPQAQPVPLQNQPNQPPHDGFGAKPGLHDANAKPPVSCLWDDCSLFLSPEDIAGPSTSSELSQMIAALECHLLQDHLGLQTHCHPHPHPPAIAQPTPATSSLSNALCYTCHGGSDLSATSSDHSLSPHPHVAMPLDSPSTASPPLPLTPSSSSPSDTQQDLTHQCKWQSCPLSFATSEELTAHLTAVHVGGGKAHYECFWDGCDRHGDRGFSSKQKVCRHLQSHTGYRPFQCTLCHQNFSEAATLQQHMRRHTQEKPYACDFPGCGKSFAIMGALTIHKRIHNGLKPFKCPHCERAFTESSNLSKHLRTHTGARPYSCMEPGCGKCFARPDQLTRHQAVHRNKALPGPVANQE